MDVDQNCEFSVALLVTMQAVDVVSSDERCGDYLQRFHTAGFFLPDIPRFGSRCHSGRVHNRILFTFQVRGKRYDVRRRFV